VTHGKIFYSKISTFVPDYEMITMVFLLLPSVIYWNYNIVDNWAFILYSFHLGSLFGPEKYMTIISVALAVF